MAALAEPEDLFASLCTRPPVMLTFVSRHLSSWLKDVSQAVLEERPGGCGCGCGPTMMPRHHTSSMSPL
eukprot:scaffold30020_cov24-Tisochrysis_lutea.AAC.4